MIRSALTNDRLPIGRVYSETWQAAYRGIVPDGFLVGLTAENCAPQTIQPECLLVYQRNGEIIGVTAFGENRNGTDKRNGEIYSLYVLKDHWHTGAGRTLFEAARENLRRMGYQCFFVWVLTENKQARRFYGKMGMIECAQRSIRIGGCDLAETGYFQTLN